MCLQQHDKEGHKGTMFYVLIQGDTYRFTVHSHTWPSNVYLLKDGNRRTLKAHPSLLKFQTRLRGRNVLRKSQEGDSRNSNEKSP